MSRLTDTSFESAMENLDAFDLIEWQGEIYNKLAEYERLGSVDYFKYCKNIEKSDLSHELEVYKKALELAFKSVRVEYDGYCYFEFNGSELYWTTDTTKLTEACLNQAKLRN